MLTPYDNSTEDSVTVFMETLNMIKSYEIDTGRRRLCDTSSDVKVIAVFNQNIDWIYSTPKGL